jgi:hypothetical protein
MIILADGAGPLPIGRVGATPDMVAISIFAALEAPI